MANFTAGPCRRAARLTPAARPHVQQALLAQLQQQGRVESSAAVCRLCLQPSDCLSLSALPCSPIMQNVANTPVGLGLGAVAVAGWGVAGAIAAARKQDDAMGVSMGSASSQVIVGRGPVAYVGSRFWDTVWVPGLDWLCQLAGPLPWLSLCF